MTILSYMLFAFVFFFNTMSLALYFSSLNYYWLVCAINITSSFIVGYFIPFSEKNNFSLWGIILLTMIILNSLFLQAWAIPQLILAALYSGFFIGNSIYFE